MNEEDSPIESLDKALSPTRFETESEEEGQEPQLGSAVIVVGSTSPDGKESSSGKVSIPTQRSIFDSALQKLMLQQPSEVQKPRRLKPRIEGRLCYFVSIVVFIFS